MPKKRLIFALLYRGGSFCLSRNFRLQKVGDANWLERNYDFFKVSRFIDELVILNVESESSDQERFLSVAAEVTSHVFVPVSLGGAIRNLADAEAYFQNGADKIVLNTLLWRNPAVVQEIAKIYGEQAIVASIDYLGLDEGRTAFFRDSDSVGAPNLTEWITNIASLGVGELLLNSVDRDGTGMGLDDGLIATVPLSVDLPIVLMGGVGRTDHFGPALESPRISGVATSNLFAFMGQGLAAARAELLARGVDMAEWT